MNDLKTLFKSIIVCFMLMLCGSVRAEGGSYTIVFGNKLNGPQPLNSTISAATTISEGLEFVVSKPYTVDVGNCYYGDSVASIRIGKSGSASKLTIGLSKAGQVHATSVVVKCNNFGTARNLNAKISVNGAESQTTSVNEKLHEFMLNADIEEVILEGTAAIFIYSITVNYNGPASFEERKDPELAFSPSSLTIMSGESITEPTLTNKGDGEVIYSVDDKDVVTVDSLTGALTIMGSGTAVVTAISSKTAGFLADTASYTVNILPKEIIDLRGKSESITFTDFHRIGEYTVPIKGGLLASDNAAYSGWRKADCMGGVDSSLVMKKTCGIFASPIIKSDKGVKVVVMCSSWTKNFKIEMDGVAEVTNYGSGLYQLVSLSTSATETSFILYSGSGATTVKSIEIVPFTDADVLLPTYSHASGTYNEPQTVSLSAADGCTIYYSTDGTAPSIEYTGPISVTKTTTIQAIAKDAEGRESEVAKATYTIEAAVTLKEYTSIAALIAARPANKCILTLTNAQVLFASGSDVYVRDETGAIDFYMCGLLYTEGQVLNGSVTVTYSKYYDIPEVRSVNNNHLVATEGTSVPKEVEVNQVTLKDYVCDYIKVKGTLENFGSDIYVSDGSQRLIISNKFGIHGINLSTIGNGSEVEVSGIVVPYSTSSNYYYSSPRLAVMKIEVTAEAPLLIPSYNNIAEVISAAPKGRFYLMLNDAQVLYAGANDMYVKDATGTINFYECGLEYKTGQVLNGKILAHYEHFRRLIPEISKVTEQQVTAVDGTVFPLEVSITDILGGEYTSEFVTTTGTLVIDAENGMNYLSDGTTQVSIYNNRFNLPDIDLTTFAAGAQLTVTGIVVPQSTYPQAGIPQIALLSIGTTSAEVNYYGDCNLDGFVNISDVVQLVNYILGNGDGSGVFSMLNADVNGDRNVNIIDVVEVVNMILNSELRPRTNSGTSE